MSEVLEQLRSALSDRYVIERELGRGGMAIVYLAEDLKLHRQVAIKVLRPELSASLGTDRFVQEIELTAKLQHPQILPLYEAGEAEGFLYYVMPYVEGESLRDRMQREGKLPVEETARITDDVASALSYAHDEGIVHRDIKPENIMLTRGRAVVADFGIARALTVAGGERLTATGVAVGTPAYMSPEQAVGEENVDARSDVYALGCVVYEMVGGRAPFEGSTAQALLAKHAAEEVPGLRTSDPAIPLYVERAVERALSKSPDDRFQSASEFAAALTTGTVVARVKDRHRSRIWVPGVGAAAVTLLGFFGWRLVSDNDPVLTISNTRQLTRAPEIEFEPRISPDEDEVAYTAGFRPDMHIYVQDLAGDGRPISVTADRPGTQVGPSWTSDGRSLVFYEYGQDIDAASHMIPRFGGVSRTVLAAPVLGIHGDRLAYLSGDSLLVRSLNGSESTLAATGAGSAHSVAWSPDGSLLAYVKGNSEFAGIAMLGNVGPSSIWAVHVEGGEPKLVTDHPSLNVSPAWMPDGRHLLFVSDREGPRDIYMIRVDRAGEALGEPTRVTTGLEAHSISVSSSGSKLAYSKFTIRRNIWEVPIPDSGNVSLSHGRQVTLGNQIVESHAVSRDGRWLAFDSDRYGNQDIYLQSLEGGEPRRLTVDSAEDFKPDFSPDGTEIVFQSLRYGTRDIILMHADGSNQVRLTDDPREELHPAFSPDGLQIAFSIARSRLDRQVYVMSRAELGAAWSAPEQLTVDGGSAPRWSPDGSRIVYRHSTGIRIVSLVGDEESVLEVPVAELRGDHLEGLSWPFWSQDGQSIYFVADTPEAAGEAKAALFEIPVAGGRPRLMVHSDDPTKSLGGYPFFVHDGKVYLTVSEFESDIYVMDLEIR